MKIISLNIWGGRMHDELMAFLQDHQDTDVFCFQEVYHEAAGKEMIWVENKNLDIYNDLRKLLTNYESYHHPHLGDWWGLAVFVKKGIEIAKVGDEFVHAYKGYDIETEKLGHTAKNIQYVELIKNGAPFTIINFHGLWNGKGKSDTPERIVQSQNIVQFCKEINHPYLICGDFNLLPDTESLQLIEQELGLQNLIKKYGITSTRTSLYTKPERYADYMFIAPEVGVKDFRVLPDEVSDHAPLFIEIE